MNTNELTERYKNIPGKIIPRTDVRLTLASDSVTTVYTENEKKLQQGSDEHSHRTWLKIATSDPDRSGDVMVIAGVVTDNFDRNPQFLWQHGLTSEPVHTIGRIVKLFKTASALYA